MATTRLSKEKTIGALSSAAIGFVAGCMGFYLMHLVEPIPALVFPTNAAQAQELQIVDERGTPQIVLSARHGVPSIVFPGKSEGQQSLLITVDGQRRPMILLRDSLGKERARFGVAELNDTPGPHNDDWEISVRSGKADHVGALLLKSTKGNYDARVVIRNSDSISTIP